MPISVVMLIPFAITVFVFVLIAVAIPIAIPIFVLIAVAIPIAIPIFVLVLILVLISIGITAAASTIPGFVSIAVSNYAFGRTIGGGAISAVRAAITVRAASDLSGAAVTAI
jgi:hypothetical protein